MNEHLRFSYTDDGPAARPLLSLVLHANGQQADVLGLLDSGASVNVLPYAVGRTLGFIWEEQTTRVQLGGNLASAPAVAVVVEAQVGEMPPKRLVFAWSRAEEIPVLLGQMNFFAEYDVCFFRAENAFSLRSR